MGTKLTSISIRKFISSGRVTVTLSLSDPDNPAFRMSADLEEIITQEELDEVWADFRAILRQKLKATGKDIIGV